MSLSLAPNNLSAFSFIFPSPLSSFSRRLVSIENLFSATLYKNLVRISRFRRSFGRRKLLSLSYITRLPSRLDVLCECAPPMHSPNTLTNLLQLQFCSISGAASTPMMEHYLTFTARATMSAKSLGTFPVICAIDEVQNPLPLKTMLFNRHMTSIIGISDTFPNS